MNPDGDAPGLLARLTEWVTANAGWIAGFSLAYFLLSLVAVRFLIVRLPAEYFLHRRPVPSERRHPAAALALTALRNLLGALVILVGLVMSLPGVPGQGFLTLLIGLTLTDFPGKRALELWILRRPLILRGINGMRERAGRPPLAIPDGVFPDPSSGTPGDGAEERRRG